MYIGFPVEQLSVLRCAIADCTGRLELTEPLAGTHVRDGWVRCSACERTYPVENGILRLLDADQLDAESTNELRLRDIQAIARSSIAKEELDWDQMEIVPTMKASQPLAGVAVLELGAGTGRYSVRLASEAASLLAVDFSLRSLEVLADRLKPQWKVALVQADCTQLRVAPNQFDLVASTLVSNLPTEAHRRQLFELAASALRDRGKFVFSTHQFSLSASLAGEPRSGYYREGGIYRYLFEAREIRREVLRFFDSATCRPIQIPIPAAGRLGVALAASRAFERLWPVNRLGELLLVSASTPRRAHATPA